MPQERFAWHVSYSSTNGIIEEKGEIELNRKFCGRCWAWNHPEAFPKKL